MSVQLGPLRPDFVAEVSGLDLARPMDTATVDALWSAIDQYAVRSFATCASPTCSCATSPRVRAAGDRPRRRPPRPAAHRNPADRRHIQPRHRQQRARLDDRRRLDSLGNRLWHTDASYMPVPVVLGMLHAVALPPPSPFGNGETEFADMRAAYDALPDGTKAAIEVWSSSTTSSGRAARSASPSSRRASASNIRRRRNGWCASIRDRGARRSICPRTPRTSSGGRWRTAGCCCGT